MCGITGFAPSSAIPDDSHDLLRRMCGRIIHRGPDESGAHITPDVALGMRRLSIIDIAGGSQPIFNEDRSVCAIQNGEIYNFQEVARELEKCGHRFATRCDTEVIVHAYEEYGLSFVEHLNGMFAIALWDESRRRLVLVRDRVGVKPLFYAYVDGVLLFASEIKCLLEWNALPRTLDHQAVYNYFALGYVPAPRTVYAHIRKLPPATMLLLENGRVSTRRYWGIPTEVEKTPLVSDAAEGLLNLLDDAVRIRMISDVPLGAFLSGGLDSSITVALMAQHSSTPVKTFFIDFDEPSHSERHFASTVAQHFHTDHHELVCRPDAMSIVETVAEAFDEPFADASAIPTYYVSKLTRQHVTVALAGDGGDESFGGYQRYRRILGRRELPVIRRLLRPIAEHVPSVLPLRLPGREYIRSLGLTNAEHYVIGTHEYLCGRLLAPEFLESVTHTVATDLSDRFPTSFASSDPLQRYSLFDFHSYLPDDILTKVDRMSMYHSLEVRGPFLDYRLMEFAARLPVDFKIRENETKWLLKRAFGGSLPASILEQRKRGFSVPLATWLRRELRPLLEDVAGDPTLLDSGIVQTREVRRLMAEHDSGVRDRSVELWRIIMFGIWYRQISATGSRKESFA